jgi:hypothetical protein
MLAKRALAYFPAPRASTDAGCAGPLRTIAHDLVAGQRLALSLARVLLACGPASSKGSDGTFDA